MATPAQIAANRANSLKSCGPKSEEGKRVARANSLRHGMSGSGAVIAAVDLAEVESRTAAFLKELNPRTERGKYLARQMAAMSVRVEKIGRHSLASADYRARHAVETFDQGRQELAQATLDGLATNPRVQSRKLRQMPEGVELLIESWDDLKSKLTRDYRPTWTPADLTRVLHLQGHTADDPACSHFAEPSDALWAESDPAKAKAKRLKLAELIDREIAALEKHYEALDHEEIDLDREEATLRAEFEPSKAVELAHRYEAEASRRYSRCLKELREVEAKAAEEEKTQKLASTGAPPRPIPPPPSMPAGPLSQLGLSWEELSEKSDDELEGLIKQTLAPGFVPATASKAPVSAPGTGSKVNRRVA